MLHVEFMKFCQNHWSLLYIVKKKGGKPDRKPYPLPFGFINPYRNLKSENSQQNCAFMNSTSELGECLVVVYGNRKRNIHITISSQGCRHAPEYGDGGGGRERNCSTNKIIYSSSSS